MGLSLRRGSMLLTAAALLAATLTGVSQSSSAEVVAVPDPERNSAKVTPWGWHGDANVSEIQEYVGTGNRIVDLEVNGWGPTFSVSYVKNKGAYARDWWWYPSLTQDQLSTNLTLNNARLIDIEPHYTELGMRYAAVMVANTGVSRKSWAWYGDAPLATINAYANAHTMRLVDVDRVPNSSNYAAVMIKNRGVDQKSWWHYYDITATQLDTYLKDNKARPINVERLSNGHYDVIMQARAGEYWNHVYGLTAAQLTEATHQLGMRIFQLKSRLVDDTRYYDALLINNVNAETTRIRQLVHTKMKGKWGFYLKKVGGPELAALGEQIVFEPASMIKIVHAVRALREIQFNPEVSQTTMVTWYVHPDAPARYPTDPDYRKDDDDADVCPYDDEGNLITTHAYEDQLGDIVVEQTMKYSDNRTTDALTSRYGFDELNLLMAGAGMAKSSLNHRINCGNALDQPQPVSPNRLTLRDAAKLYEQVQDGSLLNKIHRNLLYSFMFGGQYGGQLRDLIEEILVKAGLTHTERFKFLTQLTFKSKGGSYTNCDSSNCYLVARTEGGVLWIPFKSATKTIVDVPYVFGKYYEADLPCTREQIDFDVCSAYGKANKGLDSMMLEMLRTQVVKAAKTWIANRD